MKKLLKNFFLIIVRMIYFIYPLKTHYAIKKILNKIYTFWVSNSFKSYKSLSINYPIIVKGGQYIQIGDRFSTLNGLKIEAWDYRDGEKFNPQIIIGENVSFSSNCHVAAINKVVIGNNVLIGSNVFISDHSHGKTDFDELKISPKERKLFSKGPVIIHDDVWIGENVSVLPNVCIGKNSVIGANAVVSKNIPEFSVVIGNPAKIISKKQ